MNILKRGPSFPDSQGYVPGIRGKELWITGTIISLARRVVERKG